MSISITEALQQPPGDILNTLSHISANKQGLNQFNWLGMAQVASSNSIECSDEAESIQWAKVALFAYDILIKNDPLSAESYGSSTMNLRVRLIVKYLSLADNDDFGSNQVVKWFISKQIASINEVQKKSCLWRNLPPQEILILRQLKNRIRIIEPLVNLGLVENQVIANWIAIKSLLP